MKVAAACTMAAAWAHGAAASVHGVASHAHPVCGHCREASRGLCSHPKQLRLQRRLRLVRRVLAEQGVACECLARVRVKAEARAEARAEDRAEARARARAAYM